MQRDAAYLADILSAAARTVARVIFWQGLKPFWAQWDTEEESPPSPQDSH